MRRRSFVAALPLAAAGTLRGFRAEAQGQQGQDRLMPMRRPHRPSFSLRMPSDLSAPMFMPGTGLPEPALQAGRRRWAVRARRERRIRWPR